ncbi:MAG: 5-guanidino-2-oxopentanoate decarboxylase [bacterium]|nr:5-guanidino-2-oxopentanoate decarboxylase [bacterium]
MTTPSTGEALIHLLRAYGVDTVFGMPGVHTLDFYRALPEAGIRHIGVRHEQGAGFMADGYARISGRPGVCLLISGPGITNAATPIGQAFSDSQPMLVLSSVASLADLGMGRGRLHEIPDQRAVTAPITHFSELATTPAQATELVHRAFAHFASHRPRPCHISVPLDVLPQPFEGTIEAARLPGLPAPDSDALDAAASLASSCGPAVIIAGGGSVDAADEVRALAERLGAAVLPTIAGKGVMPADHPLSLEMTADQPGTQSFICEAGLVIAVGTEFAEPDFWIPEPLPVTGKLIRIDIDAGTLARDWRADVAILGDAARSLDGILRRLEGRNTGPGYGGDALDAAREAGRADFGSLERLHEPVIRAIRNALPPDGYCFTDMTQIAYSGYALFPANRPRQWFFPAGYGTLGFALPAAIGAAFAAPERSGAVLIGDGGLQFTVAELATAVEHELPLAIVLWDNHSLKQIARFMREQQIEEIGVHPRNPDFAMLAQAYGMAFSEPSGLEELSACMRQAWKTKGPTLVRIDEFADWVQEAARESR